MPLIDFHLFFNCISIKLATIQSQIYKIVE